MLRVSLATIDRYVRLRREGHASAGKRHSGMTPRIGVPEWVALEAPLAAVGTEASLQEHGELWHTQQGVRVSVQTISRVGSRGRMDLKKSLSASEQDPEQRAAWRVMTAAELRATNLVFVDDTADRTRPCSPLLTRKGWLPP